MQKDAAGLYEFAEMYERAASIYIGIKSFSSAAPLMRKLNSEKCSNLHGQFGKAKEKEGKYEDAIEAYCLAGLFSNRHSRFASDWHQQESTA